LAKQVAVVDNQRSETSSTKLRIALYSHDTMRIGHLHAHFATEATAVTGMAARFAGVPYSFTAHAKDIFHESVDPEVLRRKLTGARAAITVSDFNLQYLRETYGQAGSRVRRLYNGLDLSEYPYAAPERRAPTIVAVGRLVEKKGFADLIDACAVPAADSCGFACQIIGAGELECDLQERIESLALGERVELVGPQNNPQALAVAIRRLLAEAKLRVQLAEKARCLVEQQFDVHCNTAVLRELFFGRHASENETAKPRLREVG